MESCNSHWLVREIVGQEKKKRIVFYAAVAHLTAEDDVYKGYFIPKGAMVVPNVW